MCVLAVPVFQRGDEGPALHTERILSIIWNYPPQPEDVHRKIIAKQTR